VGHYQLKHDPLPRPNAMRQGRHIKQCGMPPTLTVSAGWAAQKAARIALDISRGHQAISGRVEALDITSPGCLMGDTLVRRGGTNGPTGHDADGVTSSRASPLQPARRVRTRDSRFMSLRRQRDERQPASRSHNTTTHVAGDGRRRRSRFRCFTDT